MFPKYSSFFPRAETCRIMRNQNRHPPPPAPRLTLVNLPTCYICSGFINNRSTLLAGKAVMRSAKKKDKAHPTSAVRQLEQTSIVMLLVQLSAQLPSTERQTRSELEASNRLGFFFQQLLSHFWLSIHPVGTSHNGFLSFQYLCFQGK